MRSRPDYSPACCIGLRKPRKAEWVDELNISSHGVEIGLRTNQAGLLARLTGFFPPHWEPSAHASVSRQYSVLAFNVRAKEKHYVLYANSRRRFHAKDEGELGDALEGNLQLYVAEWSPRFVFVHAGVVAWKNKALVFPGRSFAGKSTMVAALLRAGAQYYSDEYAVLDEHGYVYPYARRLALRQAAAVPNLRVDASFFGSPTGCEPIPVGLVVFCNYREGTRTSFRSISSAQCLMELLRNTVPVRRFPHRSLAAVHAVSLKSGAIQGIRGEAQATVPYLLNHCEQATPIESGLHQAS